MTKFMLSPLSKRHINSNFARRMLCHLVVGVLVFAIVLWSYSGRVHPARAQEQPAPIAVLPDSVQRAVVTNPDGNAFIVVLLDHSWIAPPG